MTTHTSPLWNADAPPRLLASRDRRSGELVFPAVDAASPLRDAHDDVPVASVGRVYSFTVIHPSAKSGEAPHVLGFVDFDGPVRIFGRLTGQARPAIGDRYHAQPDDRFGYLFVATDD